MSDSFATAKKLSTMKRLALGLLSVSEWRSQSRIQHELGHKLGMTTGRLLNGLDSLGLAEFKYLGGSRYWRKVPQEEKSDT